MKKLDHVLVVGSDTAPIYALITRSLYQSKPLSFSVVTCSNYSDAKRLVEEQEGGFDLICLDDFVTLFAAEKNAAFDFIRSVQSHSSRTTHGTQLMIIYSENARLRESMKVLEMCEFVQKHITTLDKYEIDSSKKFDKEFKKLVPVGTYE